MSKPYATLTVPEKWQWHAEIYAFRRVVLGVPEDEQTAPTDPNGEWFDARLLDEAVRRLRTKRASGAESRRRWNDMEMQMGGREIANQWAKRRGYSDLETYMACERIDYSDACARVIGSILAANRMPNERDDKPFAVAESLGVTAREFQPTAEDMRAGRAALGLETAESAASAA